MIRFEGITKEYEPGRASVANLNLEIEDGELMALVGPSGSGKSTILKMTAGLLRPTSGRIIVQGRDVTELAPQERDIAMVFQNYALYPYMTVRENLEFGLRIRKVAAAERRDRVQRVAEMLGLDALLDRRPAALSGGERQRVAMGRAVIREPRAFLMDEPLSNLDAQLRVRVRAEIAQLRDNLRTTTIYVTHDQVEAMTLGHRVAVLKDGVLHQVGPGRTLFDSPADRFVASFIGSPPMNFVRSTLQSDTVRLGPHELAVRAPDGTRGHIGRDVVIGIRPQAFEADEVCTDRSLPRVRVRVTGIEELGTERILLFHFDAQERAAPVTEAYQARVSSRANIRAGEHALLAIDPEALYFFDAETDATLACPSRSDLAVSDPGGA